MTNFTDEDNWDHLAKKAFVHLWKNRRCFNDFNSTGTHSKHLHSIEPRYFQTSPNKQRETNYTSVVQAKNCDFTIRDSSERCFSFSKTSIVHDTRSSNLFTSFSQQFWEGWTLYKSMLTSNKYCLGLIVLSSPLETSMQIDWSLLPQHPSLLFLRDLCQS